ncbi:MAG: PAS domain-containing protein [Planctomycetota bacterium]
MPTEQDLSQPDPSGFETLATFRALADSLPISMLIKSSDGRRVYANRAYLRWREVNWEDVAGKTDGDLFPPSIARLYQRDDERVMESRQPLHDIEKTQDGQGTVRWIERVKSPIEDGNGKLLGVQVMFWDVTDRVAADEAARFEQSLLTTLLDNIPDSIYFKDRDSRFLRVSSAMAEKFGLTDAEEVHGQSDADIFTPHHAEAAREDELHVIETGEPLVGRVERETWPDKDDTWCLTTKMPLRNDAGEIIGTFGLSRDITSLKRTEAALRDAVRMADEANRAKSEFLANMSHEIRTPMNAIIGMADLLSQTELSDDQRDYVITLRDSADSLLRLINDILDFSKIEARRLELEAVPFSMRSVAQRCQRTLQLQADQKGLHLTCDIDNSVPVRLIGDPGRLRQVLVNLIGNALKFTDQGGVTVSIKRRFTPGSGARSSSSEGDPFSLRDVALRISVADTGIGIPQEKQAEVLAPFSQADTSTTRRFGGTGLGLSISRQLVELMGGRLQLHSQVGVGTTFYFDLTLPGSDVPVQPDPDDAEEDLGVNPAWGQRVLRVLVAEDGVTNQHVIAGLLRALGHECVIASDGREAVSRYHAEPFDLILMDMHMPVMDGLEATRAIRESERGTSRHIPIVALTAAALSEDADACREAGMDDHLTKPIHSRKLNRALRRFASDEDDLDLTIAIETDSTVDGVPPRHAKASSKQNETIRQDGSKHVTASRWDLGSDTSSDLNLSPQYADCLDLDSARSRIPGGSAGVRRLAAVFRTECRQLAEELLTEIKAQDQDAARRTAHTLKGACGLLGAKTLQSIAMEIETAGRESRLPANSELIPRLQEEASRVLAALDDLLADEP